MTPAAGLQAEHPRKPADLSAWIALLATPGVGRETARRLLRQAGSAEAVLRAAPAVIEDWLHGAHPQSRAVSRALGSAARTHAELIEHTEAWLAGSPRRAACTLGDPLYPVALLQMADPPLVLYLEGRIELLGQVSVAIVGSRRATAQGLENARMFAAGLSEAGITVVSGLALGIDAAAHEGALPGAGRTVAVVGTGLDSVYPTRHRHLAERVMADGLMVSEYPLGTPALKEHFPQRNRIIAGLARGTLVIEATLPSGSLITARLAAECGRDVMAVPGSIHAPQAQGCHALIKQGAALVESVDDVLQTLEWGSAERSAGLPKGRPQARQGYLWAPADRAAPDSPADAAPKAVATDEPPSSSRQARVLEALGHDPRTLDALVDRTGWPPAELSAVLLELELDGHVARLPGGQFQRLSRA